MELPDNLLAELEILENITSCNKVLFDITIALKRRNTIILYSLSPLKRWRTIISFFNEKEENYHFIFVAEK